MLASGGLIVVGRISVLVLVRKYVGCFQKCKARSQKNISVPNKLIAVIFFLKLAIDREPIDQTKSSQKQTVGYKQYHSCRCETLFPERDSQSEGIAHFNKPSSIVSSNCESTKTIYYLSGPMQL